MTEKTCHCPDTYPDWHEKDINLSGKPTHTLPIASFMFMPLSLDSYLNKQQSDIDQLELQEEYIDLVLTRTGLFRGEIVRLLTSGDSPSRHIRYLPSNFNVRGFLHQGGIGTIKQATLQLQATLFDLGRMPKELYMCYLTCPVCSEAKGGDKILLLRRWQQSKTLFNRISKQKKP
jgi:hypothetical protein